MDEWDIMHERLRGHGRGCCDLCCSVVVRWPCPWECLMMAGCREGEVRFWLFPEDVLIDHVAGK